MSNLTKLIDYGQSYRIDNLTRNMIKSGELKKRIIEEGLRGQTSNFSLQTFYMILNHTQIV